MKKSKALGPDGLAPILFHHLGPRAISALTFLINDTGRIPMIWKSSIILPLLKAGKQAADGSSYRPISLLSPVAKVIERLLLNSIQSNIPPTEHQHGFASGRSTTSALLTLSQNIAEGFNEKRPAKRTVLMAIDMSKAFDSINIFKLIDLLLSTSMPNYIKKWLSSYLRGRKGRTSFRNTLSSSRLIRNGVPQGSALSPTLFNLYLRDLPTDSAHTKVVSYADDITIWASNSNISTASEHLRTAIPRIESFLKGRSLDISPLKSQLMLFTPYSREYKTILDVSIGGTAVHTVNQAKLLGVTYDSMFTFSHHARDIASRMTQRNNVLKGLAGSTWGNQKETLRLTFKAISQAIYSYAAPAWSTYISDSAHAKIQRAQNAGLRIVTGNHQMADIDHIHRESKVMRTEPHLHMISAQYLARSLDTAQFHHGLLRNPSPPRAMKSDLLMSCKTTVETATLMSKEPRNGRLVANAIHTTMVSNEMCSMKGAIILGGRPPPDIQEEEKDLPRSTRCTLSQLRSGFSRFTKHYLHRIDDSIPDVCPDCSSGPHDVAHLFNCTGNPTTLAPIDLWKKPLEVAAFLKI